MEIPSKTNILEKSRFSDKFIVGNQDGNVTIFSESGEKIKEKNIMGNSWVLSHRQLKNGKLMAGGYFNNKLSLFNNNLELEWELPGNGTRICDILELSDGRVLSCGTDYNISVWNITKRKLISTFKGHNAEVLTLLLDQNGMLFTGGCDNTLRIWDTETGKCVNSQKFKYHIHALANISPSLIGMAVFCNKVEIIDLTSYEIIQTSPDSFTNNYYSKALTSDLTNKVVYATGDNCIKTWDLRGGQTKITSHPYAIDDILLLKSNILVSGGRSNNLILTNYETGQEIRQLIMGSRIFNIRNWSQELLFLYLLFTLIYEFYHIHRKIKFIVGNKISFGFCLTTIDIN